MAKLALNGGEPVVKSGLGKSWPIFDETEENALLETLRSGAWNRREKVDKAGEKFAAFQDAKYGIPLANGTVALQCALKAAGITAGRRSHRSCPHIRGDRNIGCLRQRSAGDC